MREYVLVTTSDVPVEKLWAVVADVGNWAAWQPRAEPDGAVWATTSSEGAWPWLTVEEVAAGGRLTAVAGRFLAQVRFEYAFEPCARGTRVRVAVALSGPLSFAYQRAFDRHLQRSFSALVAQLIARAREAPGEPGGHTPWSDCAVRTDAPGCEACR